MNTKTSQSDSQKPVITLRPARRSDANSIVSVNREAALGMAATHYDRRTLEAWSPVSAERLEQIEKHIVADLDEGLMLVAEIEEKIAGFGRIAFSTGEIASLYVSPDAARLGVGTKIMNEMESLARKRGLVSVWLNAAMNARDFYASCGFVGEEQIEYKLPTGDTMLVTRMSKRLVPAKANL